MIASPTEHNSYFTKSTSTVSMTGEKASPADAISEHSHELSKKHPLSHKLVFWGGLAALGIVMAPHLLPAIGVGETSAVFVGPTCFPPEGAVAKGIAGWAGNILQAVPLIGEKLAEGGWVTALSSASVGIGGVLLGNFIGKREDDSRFIKWGTVIKVAALATSLFVSLPALMPAIAMGIAFLGGVGLEIAQNFGVAEATINPIQNNFTNAVVDFLGTAPGAKAGITSTSALWAHLITCGGTVGALNFASKKAVEPVSSPDYSLNFTDALASKHAASHASHEATATPNTRVREPVHYEKLSPQLSAKLAAIA